MSILNSLKGMVSDQLVSGLASNLGESNSGIQKAMGGIVPSLLGGLLGSKKEDHGMLEGLLSKAGGLLGGGGNSDLVGSLLGGLTGGGASDNSGISGIGSSLVNGLLGNKLGGLASLISNFAGIKSGSSSSLLGIGGSLVASFLGKKLLGDKLNFGGLLNLLGGEKKEIFSAAPSGFADTLGLGNLFGDVSGKVSEAVGNVSSHATNAARNVGGAITGGNDDGGDKKGMGWLWPLLLLGALAAGIWGYMKGCNKDGDAGHDGGTTPPTEQPATGGGATTDTTTVKATDATTATATSTSTVTTTQTGAAPVATTVSLPGGKTLNANAGGIEDAIVKFLNSGAALVGDADKTKDWFNFDNLNFDFGKTTITAGSMGQIDNIAAILKAYPNLKIKIGAYTDKKGDDASNMKLSQGRADEVLKQLKAKGANAAQITKAEGYGETLATVAESASDKEREADRKTAIRIIAK
jgi:outer membrane protein OmpA-like peptidoglycan-associated protein